MRVLVTGGCGFVGRNLVKLLLARNVDVRVLDNLSEQVHGPDARPPAEIEGAEFVRGDVRDRAAVAEALEGVDRIAHLACLTGVGQSMYEVERYTDVGERGTATLLQAMVDAGRSFDRLVLSSSRAVYGEGEYECGACGIVSPWGRAEADLAQGKWEPVCDECGGALTSVGTTEKAAKLPQSVYAANKLAQENLCRATLPAYGTKFVALRYFNVYGPGQSLNDPYTGILPAFLRQVEADAPIQLFEDGLESRDFVYIDDVAAATALALLAPAEQFRHDAYNVGTGDGVSVARLAETILAAAGKSVPMQVTGAYRVGDVRHAVADPSRIRNDLGFVAETGIEAGIEKWLAWAMNQSREEGAGLNEEATRQLQERNLYRSGASGAPAA